MTRPQYSSGTATPPADLAARIELYLDDAPMYGDHSDKAGGNCWELLREAMDELRSPTPQIMGDVREAPRADEDLVKKLIRKHFTEKEQRAGLLRTVWKDGIDIDRPGYHMMNFADDLLTAPCDSLPSGETYRETVRRVAAAREKRIAEMREALERIQNFPHDKTACEQAMSQIAAEALALSSTSRGTGA